MNSIVSSALRPSVLACCFATALAMGCSESTDGPSADDVGVAGTDTSTPGTDSTPTPPTDSVTPTPDSPVTTDTTTPPPVDTGPINPGSCDDFCKLVAKTCGSGAFSYPAYQGYDDIDCKMVCTTFSAWDLGTPGATTGNTLACRVTHAQAAATDAKGNCPAAGKGGGNVCGTKCENFCRLTEKNCTGANQIYKSNAECMTTCGSWAADKQDCEIYHLNAAGGTGDSATTHCPHGSATSHACG